MTSRLYTREEMVAAFWAGAAQHGKGIATFDSVQQYIDNLEAGRETAQGARGKSEIPGMVSEDALALLVAYKADFEHFTLKTNEREKALAQVIGEFVFKAPFYLELRSNDSYARAAGDWINKLNTYFPELTEGAE